METKIKGCAVCGMPVPLGKADSKLAREFEDETYYFCTGLCMVTFEIQLEKIIVERERLLEESRWSLGLSRFHGTFQLNEAVMAERERVLGKAHCTVCHPPKGSRLEQAPIGTSSETQLNNGDHHGHA